MAQSELNGPEQVTWFQRVEQERDNLREVFRWTLESHEAAMTSECFALAVRLAVALYDFWFLHGHHLEGLTRLTAMLARLEAAGRTAERAKLLFALGYLLWAQGNFAEAESSLAEAISISREVGDQRACAWSLNFLGRSLNNQGKYAAARLCLEESLSIWRALGYRIGIANSIRELADIALTAGEGERARQLYTEAVGMYKDLKDANQSIYPIRRLGYFALSDGQYEQATAHFQESLNVNLQIGDPRGSAASLAGLAAVVLAQDRGVQAAHIFGAVEALLLALAAPLLPLDHREYDRNVAALRAQLSEAEFATAWAAGRVLTMEQAVDLALTSTWPGS